jgi:hypothetical protein
MVALIERGRRDLSDAGSIESLSVSTGGDSVRCVIELVEK